MPRVTPVILAIAACLLATAWAYGQATSPAPREIPTPIDPPNLSIHLNDASLEQVTETLTQSMGTPIHVWQGGRANEKFTLNLDNKPFWDIFSAISAQHPVVPRNSNGSSSGFSMAAQSWGIQHYTLSHGFVFYVDGISRRHNVNLQAPADQQVEPEKLSLSLTFASDPRLVVLQHAPPQFTQILDDAPNGGHNLLKNSPTDKFSDDDPTHAQIWDVNFDLDVPKNLGQTIASAKGTARFLVQTAEFRTELPSPDQHLKEKIPVGIPDTALTFTAFKASATDVQFTVALALPAASKPARPANLVRMTITDAADHYVWAGSLTTASRSYSAKGTFTPPLKATLSATAKSQEITVPFELKNIPLPK